VLIEIEHGLQVLEFTRFRTAKPEWGDATMISTRIYRLIPGAPLDDHNWRRAAHQGELVVRARSSGEARAIAARAEARAAGVRQPSTGQVLASAVADPVL
jgi:hypothetical protein